MKRYLVFAGGEFRQGGWHDFAGSFDDTAKALAHCKALFKCGDADWWHIIDRADGSIVDEVKYDYNWYNDD